MDDYTDTAATFGDRLTLARERQGISSAQLARRIGLKVTTIHNWESDRSEPRANKLQMLAGFLNVSIIWLLTGEGEGAPVATLPEQPAEAAELEELITELRDLRMMQIQVVERMSRLEKHLRELQQSTTTEPADTEAMEKA
ncbi:MAG: helix-turn-helix transcriptional regulator [Pseudomonadota bacterium]